MDTHTSRLRYDVHVDKMKEKLSAVVKRSNALSPSSALEEKLQRNDSPKAQCTASIDSEEDELCNS